ARKELGVSDRALRNAWQRHGLGLPPRPTTSAGVAAPTGRVDAAFRTLNQAILPPRARSEEELAARVRRAEEYAVLGANAVVDLYTESRSPRASTRVWAITRRAQRAQTLARQRQSRAQRRQVDRAERADRYQPGHQRRRPEQREVGADAR
ncbi:MAG TPA: hypothetical protein VFD04_24985, partial [Actinomycetes bacterium]|nr:hypothetical protein [Actinomycetes bacterium]